MTDREQMPPGEFAERLIENMERVVSDAIASMPEPPPLWSEDFRMELIHSLTDTVWATIKCATLSYTEGAVATSLMQ